MLCALATLPLAGASADQTKKNERAKSQVIIVDGNKIIVIRNGHTKIRTVRPNTTLTYQAPTPKPGLKGMPTVKGDAAACVKLVRDSSGLYQSAYYRAKNVCARRVRLWVFDTNRKQWLDSIIVESMEDATSVDYDGIAVGDGEVVAACTMSGDITPPGCFQKSAGGLYAVASNNVILR
jgi:hypothetical protein